MPIRDVFIIMPFGEQRLVTASGDRTYTQEHFDDVYSILCDAVREHDGSTNVNRMEQPYGNLVTAIIRRLANAEVVIAVLAGRNPNVFYELGVRHSLRLNTMMLVEHRDEYPFDLGAYFSHQYSVVHEADRRSLKQFVKRRLDEFAHARLPDSPVLDVLQQSEFEQLRVLNTWETRRAALIFEGLIREVRKVYAVFAPRYGAALKFEATSDTALLKPMRLTWNVIDGFTKNRPVPGLPRLAYEDAETVYGLWTRAEAEWNDLISRADVEPGDLQQLVASSTVSTMAFLHDVVVVLEYLMATQRAYAIPWQGSFDKVHALVEDTRVLGYAGELIDARTKVVLDDFAAFEDRFLGLPTDLVGLTTTPASVSTIEDVVREAKVLEAAHVDENS